MSSFLKYPAAVLRLGTRFHGPSQPASPRLYSFALAFQPLIGLVIGAAAAILPVFICVFLRGLHGLMLLSAGIYLFLMEWLARFENLHAFDRSCRLLSGYGASAEERMSRLAVSGNSPCTALLTALKLLTLYLIFLRMALFGENLMLAFMLIIVPAIGRTAMLFAYPSIASETRPHVNMGVRIIYPLALLLIMTIFIGAMRMFGGDFFSLRSMKLTMSGFGTAGSGVNSLLAIVSLGFQDALGFLAAGFLPVMYWNTEAAKKLGREAQPLFAGALCETAELSVLVVFLILADDLIF